MFSKHVTLASLLIVGFAVFQILTNRTPRTAYGMTAHGTERKTMVTVPLDAGMEAVVTLDHITGEMTGYVLNRLSGKFFVRYRHNVNNEFPAHKGSYLMATGLADFRGFDYKQSVASGVIYVSEDNSRRVVAYAMPWNPQFENHGGSNEDLNFVMLDQAATRFTHVR